MGAFSGKDGEFILKNAVENVKMELVAGNISKKKAYAIAKGAPNSEAAQNAGLSQSKDMTAEELEIFVRILFTRFTPKQEI